MKTIIKVCGNQFNVNFSLYQTKKIINILVSEFRNTKGYDIELMELIAGFSFVILRDFDCLLQDEATLEEDKKQTIKNIDKLYNYLYGGYHDDYHSTRKERAN